MLKKQYFDNEDENLSLENMSLEDMTHEFSQEGILDKLFPSIKRKREEKNKKKKEFQEAFDKDMKSLEDITRGVVEFFGEKNVLGINKDTVSIRGNYPSPDYVTVELKDNTVVVINSLHLIKVGDHNLIEATADDGVLSTEPYILDTFGSPLVNKPPSNKLTGEDASEYIAAKSNKYGLPIMGDVDKSSEYVISIMVLDGESYIDHPGVTTGSGVAYTLKTFGEKTFKSAVDKVVSDSKKDPSKRNNFILVTD